MSRSKITTEDFIIKAKYIHKNKYDYSKSVYIKSSVKLKIICKEHGEFLQTPNNHLSQKQGCPKCAGNIKDDSKTFIEKANIIHNNNYNYSKVKYTNNKKKVNIICSIHGEFTQRPCDHINQRQGCPKCANKNITTEEFIKKVENIHDGKYNYKNFVYTKALEKSEIICPIHGSFFQKPSYHINGSGCPNCSESKGEKRIVRFLKNKNIVFERQKKFEDCINPATNKQLSFDFYIKGKRKFLLEYDGEYHYEPWRMYWNKEEADKKFKELKERDKIKDLYCISNKLDLVRIPFFEFKNIEKILSDYLFKTN